MANTIEVPEPMLVSVKAVDPAVYPFYGEVNLDPPAALRAVLDSRSAAVSDDLLFRLKTRVGGNLRLGGQDFRIAALLVSEPDRLTGSINVGPRVMISRQGLERTGLISLGSRAAERYLFLLPPRGPGVEQVRNTLKRAFPEGLIADYRETHPIITRGLERSTTFLSLISLIALIVGALGVATAMHAHLQQKMDTIAVLKCIGARSGQVLRIYLAQTLALGLAGGVLGVAFGIAGAARLSGPDRPLFPGAAAHGAGSGPRNARPGDRHAHHAAVHFAHAAGHPRNTSGGDFPPRYGRRAAGLAAALEPFAPGAGDGCRHPGGYRADRRLACRHHLARFPAHRRVLRRRACWSACW